MPSVLLENGYRFFFFSNEGNPLEPCHIHVRKHGALAKFWIKPEVELADNIGFNAKAKKVWSDDENLWLLLVDGRQLSIPLVCFPKLKSAGSTAIENYELSGEGLGIHWDALDEDLYVPNLLMGITSVKRTGKIA